MSCPYPPGSHIIRAKSTSALDTHLGEQVTELMRSELNGRGTAAVVITHDDRMTHYYDRVVHIVDGVLTE